MLKSDRQVISVPDRAAWRAWLEHNHATSPGVWLVLQKKNSDRPGVSYEEAVQEAVAYGWIDSTLHRRDEHSVEQLYTPRRPGGTWSASNKERVAQLLAEDRMHAAGLAAVERAKADGSWDALTDVENLVIPTDLMVALEDDPDALRHWTDFNESSRKMIVWWVVSAKRADTRQRRIRHVVEMASRGLRAGLDE